MPLELALTGRWHPKPEALEVKSSAWASSGWASTGKARMENKVPRRRAVVRKESADTQEDESCQQNDMEVDKDEGMEEFELHRERGERFGWVARTLRAKYMCDKSNKEGFKFFDIAAILEDDGKSHTINLCKNCYDMRLSERNELKVTGAGWKAMIERKVSRWFCQKNVGAIENQKSCGKKMFGRINESGAARDKQNSEIHEHKRNYFNAGHNSKCNLKLHNPFSDVRNGVFNNIVNATY